MADEKDRVWDTVEHKQKAAIRCTVPSCSCECFSPGKNQLRVCDTCKHGWVSHALDKLGYRQVYNLGMQVELVQPNIVFDIASLMLYGTQATPIRLKILLDRLFSVLQHEEVLQVLHGFGWSYEDYARGYILQDPSGRVLDKWIITSREEEQVILQQFLRFGETRSIAQEIILQDTKDRQESLTQSPKTESEIKKFIERSGSASVQSYVKNFDIAQSGRSFWNTRLAGIVSQYGGTRMLSPSAIQSSQSPNSSTGNLSRNSGSVSGQTASPDSSSPLGRLSTMQPYDYRRERLSPAASAPSPSPVKSEPSSTPGPELRASPLQTLPPSASTTPPKPPQLTPIQSMIQGSMLAAMIPRPVAQSPILTPVFEPKQEEGEGAINYSLKESDTGPSSVFAERKIKHLRKSANPMKRNWNPSPSFGSTLISPSGKKRVLCTACNKTFCDKGALKIHYSAVHLKEMHKCTVQGCNMMFSSRRSRNRHSANPNPKLHMPQKPRKLPEGAVCIDESKFAEGSPSPTPLSYPSYTQGLSAVAHLKNAVGLPTGGLLPQDLTTTPDQAYFVDANNRLSMLPPSVKKQRFEEEEEESIKESHLEPQPVKHDELVEVKQQEPAGRTNKRKKTVPTRCAQQTEEVFVMSDDNDNDDNDNDNSMDSSCSNSDGNVESEGLEVEIGEDLSQEGEEEDKNLQHESQQQVPLGSSIVQQELEKSLTGRERSTFQKMEEAAMRQMGCFPGEFRGQKNNPESDYDVGSATVSPRSASSDRFQEADDRLNNNKKVEDQEEMGSDQESFGSNDSQSMGLSYDDEITEHSLEDAIDKENPRKCALCGKLFQNHFGVRIHYQNVHLKLMHTCTVEGCNAAFPSKRSRDRHSANLNLHRKLLSTSSDSDREYDNSSMREDNPMQAFENQENGTQNHNGYGGGHESRMLNPESPKRYQLRQPIDDMLDEEDDKQGFNQSDHCYSGDDLIINHSRSDSPPIPDPEGMVRCHICRDRFRDNLILKEHYEKVHPKEMYKCTIEGCDKIFSTRKSRNRHSQNDNLHRHLSPTKVNGN